MKKRVLIAGAIIALAGSFASAADPDPAVLGYKMRGDLKWNESTIYPGLRNAVLYGDPAKEGQYAVRNRFGPNAFSRPHFHPNDRIIVVISGTWWVGTGDKFDRQHEGDAAGQRRRALRRQGALRRREGRAVRDHHLRDGPGDDDARRAVSR